jgi:hypothetical protein
MCCHTIKQNGKQIPFSLNALFWPIADFADGGQQYRCV